MSKKLLFIIGTRPELIKIFPIINYLKSINYTFYKIVSTGQHKDLLEAYWNMFNIQPDYRLDIIKEGQNLTQLTAKAIIAIDELIIKLENEFKPDIIISQGDTTTVMAASMSAFYHSIPFAHIEAGLRSFNMQHPYPEEFNRKIAGITAEYHFSPTTTSKQNLLLENIPENKIHVVGNTVIDTLQYFIRSNAIRNHLFLNPKLIGLQNNCVLITCHRRENHIDLENLIEVVDTLSSENKSLTFIWPVHPNPNVKNKVLNSCLDKKENVIITEPLEYLDLIKLISISEKVISDSGGIQEEAPTFKVPVLVLREATERPEGISMGLSKLVGMDKSSIIYGFNYFKPKFNSDTVNPYGDGKSSERIVNILLK
jgi:UDP-N-acetylglucosamine 2-epimerase